MLVYKFIQLSGHIDFCKFIDPYTTFYCADIYLYVHDFSYIYPYIKTFSPIYIHIV